MSHRGGRRLRGLWRIVSFRQGCVTGYGGGR